MQKLEARGSGMNINLKVFFFKFHFFTKHECKSRKNPSSAWLHTKTIEKQRCGVLWNLFEWQFVDAHSSLEK